MSEPISGNGAATFTATGVTIAGVLSGVDDGVLIGAFAGAVIFVLSATEFALFKKVMLFGVSFLAGVVAAGFVAEIITAMTPKNVEAKDPVGALVASAMAVRFLMSISNTSASFLDHFKRGSSDVK